MTLRIKEVVALTDQPENARHMPQLSIDGNAIIARLETLADADLCPRCEQAVAAVATDTMQLLAEVIRLYELLALARYESANRLAAMRAALHADLDGESDPLAYLRDELAEDYPPDTDGGWRA